MLGYLCCKYLVSEECVLKNWSWNTNSQMFFCCSWVKAQWFCQGSEQSPSLVAAWHRGPALSTNHFQKAAERERSKPGTLSAGLLMNDLADEQWKPSPLRSQASHFSCRWRFDFHCLPILFSWPKAGKKYFSICVWEGTFTTNPTHSFSLLPNIFLSCFSFRVWFWLT